MIGVFDSGFGGLTVLKEFLRVLPDYDYIYLGDNARTPYGNKKELEKLRHDLEIYEQACPLLVPLVEEGWTGRPETKMILKIFGERD